MNTYIISQWKNSKTLEKFIDLFILLPSGITRNDQYKISVSECGMVLNVSFVWPPIFSKVDLLTKIAMKHDDKIHEEHPLVLGMTEALAELKDNVNDAVVSEHIIALPFPV